MMRSRMAILLALVGAAQAGCTRHYFRQQADREVAATLGEKNCSDWAIEQFGVYPDGRARFADPTNPDRPPMPPDDPGAQFLAPQPQRPGKSGVGNPVGTDYLDIIANWDAANRARRAAEAEADRPLKAFTPEEPLPDAVPLPAPSEIQPVADEEASADSPGPRAYDAGLKSNERPYLLTLEQACELALFNSREFQDRRENLYLAALPVTLERFAFTYQFFATEQLIRYYAGAELPDAGNGWISNSNVGFSKLFPTGALLLFRLANQVVYNFSDPARKIVATGDLSLDIVQPLLRGGGRAVTLEPLTQVERNLVYAVRGYARFRKEFYVAIAAGGNFGNNFAPGGPLPPSGTAPSEGYLPTLRLAAILANERRNVTSLQSLLRFFNALQQGGDVSQLQVDQVEQQLLRSRRQVLQSTQLLADALDRFKLQLGVPVSLPIELDETPLRPLRDQTRRFQDVFDEFTELRDQIAVFNPELDAAAIRARFVRFATRSPFTRGTRFRETFLARWTEWENLTDAELKLRSDRLRESRRELDRRRLSMELSGERFPDAERQRLARTEAELDLGRFEATLRRYAARPWDAPGREVGRKMQAQESLFRELVADFTLLLGEVRNERLADVQSKWPDLPGVALDGVDLIGDDLDRAAAAASRYALENRLDLMNARAQLVDDWRQIAVTANSLLGVANVRYHLDARTPPGEAKPFAFDAHHARHQLILNGELPLVRLPERNVYRTALINYQRGRRILHQAEDDVLVRIRALLRQLRVLAENYKIQQRAIQLAYYQVENSLNVLQEPPRPQTGTGTSTSGSSAASAAALTNQVLNAQSSLVQAQNDLATIYLNYLNVRLQLFRDLERMPLDARGVWIDERADTPDRRPDPRAGPADPPVGPDPGGPGPARPDAGTGATE